MLNLFFKNRHACHEKPFGIHFYLVLYTYIFTSCNFYAEIFKMHCILPSSVNKVDLEGLILSSMPCPRPLFHDADSQVALLAAVSKSAQLGKNRALCLEAQQWPQSN